MFLVTLFVDADRVWRTRFSLFVDRSDVEGDRRLRPAVLQPRPQEPSRATGRALHVQIPLVLLGRMQDLSARSWSPHLLVGPPPPPPPKKKATHNLSHIRRFCALFFFCSIRLRWKPSWNKNQIKKGIESVYRVPLPKPCRWPKKKRKKRKAEERQRFADRLMNWEEIRVLSFFINKKNPVP